jgi:oxygen-dependent protoporphyrinogen oxidase
MPRFVYWGGKLRKFPLGPLTASGIVRLLREPFIRSKSGPDESVRDFFIRRVGHQAHDRLVAPALTGIYAGDTAGLSIAAVLPKIVRMEREHGSLGRAFLKTLGRRGATAAPAAARPRPKGRIFSFPEGAGMLPRHLAQHVAIRYEVRDARTGDAPATVLAVPAYRACEIVAHSNPALAALLASVQYAPMVVAAVSLPDHAFKEPLNGFGFLVPRNQGLHLLGALFNSALFAGRAPKDRELLTCFVGGTFEPEAMDWPDQRVWDVVCPEVKLALQTSEMPEPAALFRHRRAIPQYNIGHLALLASIREELKKTPGLFIASNYLDGVSVPACIEQGGRTAQAVATYLGRRS